MCGPPDERKGAGVSGAPLKCDRARNQIYPQDIAKRSSRRPSQRFCDRLTSETGAPEQSDERVF